MHQVRLRLHDARLESALGLVIPFAAYALAEDSTGPSTVFVDGALEGLWRTTGSGAVDVELFRRLTRAERAIWLAAAEIAVFFKRVDWS